MTVMERRSRHRKVVEEFETRRHVVRQDSEYNRTLLTVHFSTWRIASCRNKQFWRSPKVEVFRMKRKSWLTLVQTRKILGDREARDQAQLHHPWTKKGRSIIFECSGLLQSKHNVATGNMIVSL
jgi:hypothetical protein